MMMRIMKNIAYCVYSCMDTHSFPILPVNGYGTNNTMKEQDNPNYLRFGYASTTVIRHPHPAPNHLLIQGVKWSTLFCYVQSQVKGIFSEITQSAIRGQLMSESHR